MQHLPQVAYGIDSWSHKTFTARRNYVCQNCGGTIPAGTAYLRNVVRLGSQKFKDPLRNIPTHLDCKAPWYQPEAPHRLRHLGYLPKPKAPAGPSPYHQVKPSIAIAHPELGNLLWQPPASLCETLSTMKRPQAGQATMAEIESTLSIVLTALMQASGNKRKAMKLNHLVEEITHLLDPLPVEQKTNAGI